jgi:hypothetical protein
VFGTAGEPGPIDPAGTAAALDGADVEPLVAEMLVALELMRHPASAELTARVATYLDALGGADEQAIARDYVADAREQVIADWSRLQEPLLLEPDLVDADERDVLARLQALADCPPGSLGRSWHDFYDRNGFALPLHQLTLVEHDFTHVLGGYEATPEGELALQVMLVAATDGRRHVSSLLASLLLFEVGMLPFPDIEPKVAVLARPGAAEFFADAIARGLATRTDFHDLDPLADRDLVELRAELGIPAPVPGPWTFVV